MVVLYHLWPGRLPGGFAGVDVFFVISGFLITSHLLRELASTGRVQLLRFWSRRARRLLPAAYTVIAVSAVALVVWAPELRWSVNFHEMLAASAYFENWQLAHEAVDYLAASNDPSVVQHYWTLSVEEQFYLCWPLILLGAWLLARRGRPARFVAVVIGLLTVASFGYSLWMTTHDAAAAYFVTPVRVWEFGAGALLACAARRLPSAGEATAWWSLLSWGGVAALLATAFTYSGTTPFPGWAALLPAAGAAAVIAAGMPAGRLSPAWLMRLGPVQWLGGISYALYLWHWPLLVLGPDILGHPLGPIDRVGVLALTLVLAWLSTRFLEHPFRAWHPITTLRPAAVIGATVLVAGTMVGGTLTGSHAAEVRIASEQASAQRIVASTPPCLGAAAMAPGHPCANPGLSHLMVPAPAAAQIDVPNYPGCFDNYDDDGLLDCSFGDLSDQAIPHVALIGDSHAQMYLPELVQLAQEGRITVQAQLKAACPWEAPPAARAGAYGPGCASFRQKVAGWIRQQTPGLDVIITGARFDDLPGTPGQQAHDIAAAWDVANAAGVPVIGVVDNPYRPDDPTACLADVDPHSLTAGTCAAPRGTTLARPEPTRRAAQLADDGRAVDLTDLYCGPRWCPAVIGGITVYRDISHITTTYARTLTPYLWRRLKATGLLTAS
jgi:peptidoglycan/LPS O-acetylase OafA/YrhL